MTNAELTIIIEKDEESGWYTGQIEEYPAALSQGRTIDELKANLIDALRLLLEVQKDEIEKGYASRKITKQKLLFAS